LVVVEPPWLRPEVGEQPGEAGLPTDGLRGQNAAVAKILVGVTGGIAAYKACELVRLFVKAGHDVVPLVTRGAEEFVTRKTFFALARRPEADDPYPHLAAADLLVVAPCTANTLAKLAQGLADNVLTEAALAHRGPVLLAPAMNHRMWAHAATQANVVSLLERGAELIGPETGELAEGEEGVGRMAEPADIFARAQQLLAPPSLAGTKVLVSAGGTREALDSVRLLAEEARRRGADVTLLAANLAVPPPAGVEVIETPTAEAMRDAALARADAKLVLMTAAVADYRPAAALAEKRPKDGAPWTVTLEPTADIVAELASRRTNGQVIVAFGAEAGDAGLARKREMLADKNVDLVVYNDVGREDIGFDSEENEVVLISRDGERTVARARKAAIASAVLDAAQELLETERGR
jgi:phosphopantothenoylcysteine decarboxylase / phosphopantothenate---cysteine ligase